MKTPRLVWDSKSEPPTTDARASAYDRCRIVAADPSDAELPPDAVYLVVEKWNGTDALGVDQWKAMTGPVAPPVTMVRALARLADLEVATEAAAKVLSGKLSEEGLDAAYLAKEAEFLVRTRDYYRRIASAKPFEELRDPEFFKVSSQWSDAAWEARKRCEDDGNPFAPTSEDGPLTVEDRAAVDLVVARSDVDSEEAWARVKEDRARGATPIGAATELPPVLEVSEPTAHLETDARTDDEIPY